MSNEIANALNLEPLEETKKSEVEKNLTNDYEFARGNLYDVIGRGQEAIVDMLDIAKQSQHPRSFEVLSQLLKTVVDANKDLLEINQRQKNLEKQDGKNPQTINNNLFVGSTAELQKLIKSAGNE
jgi:hypothetical protein